MSLPINITEHNAAMWGLKQDEIDLVHGRSEYQKRNEAFNDFRREHMAAGEVNGDVELLQLAREFITQAQAARSCGDRLADLLGDGIDPLVVSFGGSHYSLTKASSSYALPVFMRTVKVLSE